MSYILNNNELFPYMFRLIYILRIFLAPLKGLPGRTPPSAGFRSPGTVMGRSNSLQGTPLGGHRQNSLKKEGGIKVSQKVDMTMRVFYPCLSSCSL